MPKAIKLEEEIKSFESLLQNTASIYEKTYQVMTSFVNRMQNQDSALGWGDFPEILKLYHDYLASAWSDPAKIFDLQLKYWGDMMQVWQNLTLTWLGIHSEPVIASHAGDKRFKDEEWDKIPLFAFVKQAYLLNAQYMQEAVGDVEHLDEKKKRQLHFFTKQFVDALSPSNFIVTNPQVLRKTLDSHGENLINGLNNMLEDLQRNPSGNVNICMTDMEAFEVGKNIATTKGKVVFQNDLIQLIQYEATTKEVYEKPLLIIPPWINKYYILDLQPSNSLVKYMTDQGFTVFIISWVNPDQKFAKYTFTEYMQQGALTAVDEICNATQQKSINVVGYCIGGTLLAGTLAYLAVKNKQPINTATYFATLIDFSEPGDLGVFIDEMQIKKLENRMQKQGFLDGASMSTTFNMLRSNELIWSYYINNYLLGKEPFPFDLLYWNCDNTNLPAAMHSFYLREMYLKNDFCKPNQVKFADTPIDIRKIKVPAYFLSAHADHIAPWASTYKGALLHSGKVEFVLSGSGHIAGIVNPPENKKYAYWKNETLVNNPEEWFANAIETEGSWWPDWVNWLSQYSGKKVPARKVACGQLKIIEDAPGSYVKRQSS